MHQGAGSIAEHVDTREARAYPPTVRHALAVLAALTLLPAAAAAQTQRRAPTRAQVRELLSGIEDVPSAEDWRRVGDGALPHLIALYTDASEPPYVRLRAVGATAAFPSPAVRTFLEAVAGAEDQSDLFIAEALAALGRAFGEDAVPAIDDYLSHAEPVVREAAARQLGRIGNAPARRALQARLRAEDVAHVRATIERALR